jgi:hypothetical protein
LWKTEAIAKYPDLGIDPMLLKARKIVAASTTDKTTIEAVLSGQRDHSLAVMSTMTALEEGSATANNGDNQ